jgi:hypothetical protein
VASWMKMAGNQTNEQFRPEVQSSSFSLCFGWQSTA